MNSNVLVRNIILSQNCFVTKDCGSKCVDGCDTCRSGVLHMCELMLSGVTLGHSVLVARCSLQAVQ